MRFDANGWEAYKEFIHFALTSQDINNTAIPLALHDFVDATLIPAFSLGLIGTLRGRAKEWKTIPMLAKTHGQPATPTLLGKEISYMGILLCIVIFDYQYIQVFIERLEGQIELAKHIPFAAKFGGATGNLNAHYITYPDIDWISFASILHSQLNANYFEIADKFVTSLNLKRMQFTTQIEHYDNLAALLDNVKRMNTILLDLSKDMWTYPP